MAELIVRLLPDADGDGPTNMAADETMVRSAASGLASLRFYGWSVPTLSLGWFQPNRLRLDDPLVADLPFVRRPTGGSALVHHHELTYALALPTTLPWKTLCGRMHACIVEALRTFGIEAYLFEPHAACGSAHDLLCFLHCTPGDVMSGRHKIVGSASWKQRGALLQHGGILMAQSPFAPTLPGILDLSGVNVDRSALKADLTKRLGWTFEAGDWTDAEREMTTELIANRYGEDGWNRRR